MHALYDLTFVGGMYVYTFIYYNCLIIRTKSFTAQAIMHALMTQNLIFQIQSEMNCILLHVFLSNPLEHARTVI